MYNVFGGHVGRCGVSVHSTLSNVRQSHDLDRGKGTGHSWYSSAKCRS
jgi:hypothetical protein